MLLLLAQAIGSGPPEPAASSVQPSCKAERRDGEIVVCARRPDGASPYRIHQPAEPQEGLPKAEVRLAPGVTASAETEQADVGGFPSNRVLLRLKFKF